MASRQNKQAGQQKKQELNLARVAEGKSLNQQLPSEILNDLIECFNHYDKDQVGYISDTLFRNIL